MFLRIFGFALAQPSQPGRIAGALVALFISHRRGIYYALLTIAFGQIFWFVAIKWHSVTRGEDGLLNIKRPAFLADLNSLYYFCFAVFIVVIVFLWRLQGLALRPRAAAIRQNETRARFVGYHVWAYKWLAFTLSALVAGLAGGLFALAQQSAYPNVMSLHQSGFVVMMALIGGGSCRSGGRCSAWCSSSSRAICSAPTPRPGSCGTGCSSCWWCSSSPKVWPESSLSNGKDELFEAKHLHKRFGDHVVLEDVSMRFAEGRLTGIMGPNGAGKTTCFNLLTGRYAPDRGRVRFEGRDITGLPPRAIARLGISRSFQVMNLFDEYSALDNVLVATPEMRGRGYSMVGNFREEPMSWSASAWRTRRTCGRRISPTATAARSRSGSRSRRGRGFSSSTSRPRASAPRPRRASPRSSPGSSARSPSC